MKWRKSIVLAAVVIIMPFVVQAQVANEIKSLQTVLSDLYKELLPLCDSLIGVGRAIGLFAATWYIASRVWKSIAAAEPVDFYPLFRPFALLMAIGLWPAVIDIFNGVLQPTVDGTSLLVKNSNKTVAALLAQKEAEIKTTTKWQALVGITGEGDRDLWMQYAHKDEVGKEGFFGEISNSVEFAMAKMSYNFRNSIKQVIAIVLQIIYEAASLCINTLRIFKLLIFAIIGPLVLGLAVFDGFQHILQVYLARYINVFLWLPICNILGGLLGKIQENMLKIDLTQIQQNGDTFFSSYDLGYIIFMLIGIVCFTTVPSIADEIVFVGGGGGMQNKITNMYSRSSNAVTYGTAATATSMVGDVYSDIRSMMSGGMSSAGSGNYFSDNNSHMRNKLSGNG